MAFFYGSSTVLLAQVPSVSFQRNVSREILMSSLADDLSIPAAYGTVQKIHSSGPMTVTLIQDAHAQLGAQKNIQKLLRHLDARNAIEALFLEGAFLGPLPKDRLHFKKNAASNQRLVEKFFKKGLISGAGMYLSESKQPFAAYGLEDPELYTQNLKQLRAIFLRRSLSDAFLSDLKARILGTSSRVANPDLRKFLREWDACLEARRDLLQYFVLLSRYANRVLQLDLEDAWNQFEYPQLVRFFKVQQLESKLKGESVKLEAEKNALLLWLRSSRGHLRSDRSGYDVSPSALESVLGLNPDTVPGDLRAYFENFYLAYKDSGFEFSSYPTLKLYIAKLILGQEFDAQKMTEEAEAVTERILGKMAVGEQEKKLVENFKNYHLLKKLFALELQRKEFAEVEKKIRILAPGSLFKELQLSSGSSAVFGESVFKQAVQFYRTAVRREEAMFRNMTEILRAGHAKKAAWVIGGFHAEGIEDRLKEHGFSVVILSPKINEIQSDQNYKDILTLQHAESLNESTVPAYSLDRVSLAELGRYDARGAAYLLQAVLHELQRSVAIMAREGDGDRRELLPRMTVPLVPAARSEIRSEESFTAHVGGAMLRLQERAGYSQTFQFDRMIPVDAFEQIRLSFAGSSEQGNFSRNFKKWVVYVYPIASDQSGPARKSTAERLKGASALFLKSKDHGIAYPSSWPKVLAGLRFEFERLPGTKDQPPAMPGHFDLLGELVDGRVLSEVPLIKQGTRPEKKYAEDTDYLKGMSVPPRRDPKWILDYAQRSLGFSSTLPLNWLQELRKQVEAMQQSAELDLHGLKSDTPLPRWLGAETQLEVHMMRVRKVLKEAGTRFQKLAQKVSVLSEADKDAGAGPFAGVDLPEEPYESSPLIKVSAAVQEPWRLAEEIVHKAIQDHFKKTYAQIPTKAIRYQGQSAAVERLAELRLAGHALSPEMVKIETDPASNGTLHFAVSIHEPKAGTATAVLPKIPEGQHRQESSRRIIDRWNYISQAAHEPWTAFQDQLRVLHTAEVTLEKSVRDQAEIRYFDYGELKESIAKLNFLKGKVFNRMADAFMRAADYFPYMEPREYLDKYARRAQAETPAPAVPENRAGPGEVNPSHMPKGTLKLLGRRVPPLGIMDLSPKMGTPVQVPVRSEIRRGGSAKIPAPNLRILQEMPARSEARPSRVLEHFSGIAKLAVFGAFAWSNITTATARSEQRENFSEANNPDRDASRESLSLRIFRHRISTLFLTFLVFVSSIPSAVAQIAMSILNVPETREVIVTAHVPADLPEGNLAVQGTQDFNTWTTLTNFSISGVNKTSAAYSFALPMSDDTSKMFFRSAFWFTAPVTNVFSQTSTNPASGTTNRVGLMGVTGKPDNSAVAASSPIVSINHKVTLAWDPSPDASVRTYEVSYYTVTGSVTNSGALTNIANSVTNVMSASTNAFLTVTNLQEGATYAFFVVAVDGNGLKSEPSNTITYTVASPTQPAVVTYPENFGRLSSLTGWTNALGQWAVVDGKAKHVSGDKGILVMDFLWGTKYDAFQGEFDFHTPALDSERGVVFGFQNAQNYYWAGIDRLNGKYRVVCIHKGIRKVLNEAPAAAFADETTHTIKVSRNGITSSLYFDGNLVLEAQDPEDTFGKGRVGFYSGSPEHTLDNSLLIQSYTEAPDSTNAPVMTPGIHFLPLYSMTQQLTLQGFKELNTSVWINGQQVSPSDESTVWSTPVILTDGLNTFTILAKNPDNVESEPWTFTITLDRVAPVITLTSSGFVNSNTYVLSYTVDGILQTDTRTLVDGENLIPVSAVDAAGNITSTTFRIVVDKTPPQVSVTSADSATSADYVLRYTVDGVEKTRNVTLVEGLNQLPISEIDAAGNKTELTFSVTLDTIGPVVALALATPSLINVNSITVHYTVDGVAKAKLFEGLVEGENILTITEMDQVGNQTTASKVVTVDTIAPVVVLDASTPSLINVKTLTVQYTVDGFAKTKLFTGLVEGQNILTITETDQAGNQTTATKIITVDTLQHEGTPPDVQGAPYLNPEQFAASGAQNGIRDVIRGNGDRISRITTASEVFDYTYDANGRLEKVIQSRLGTGELGLTNLAKSGTASASSTYAGFDASKAIDEIGPTQDFGWASATAEGANDWLRVDLGKEIDLVKIKYDTRFGPSYLTSVWQRAFKLSVSVDGSNWTEVVNQSGQTSSQLYEFSFTSVRARYIKVHAIDSVFTASSGWHHAYVSELEVYEKSQGATTLAEKEYSFAYDANGRLEKVNGIWVGGTAPVVVLDAATPGLIKVKKLTVNYTVNGVAKTKLFEGLMEGPNTLTIIETDQAGNQTLVNRIVTVDTIAPAVVLDAATPSLINVKTLTVQYTVDGVAKTKLFTGLVEGENTLTITETDQAGNQTTVSKIVTVDTIGPAVVLDAATPSLINVKTLTVNYTANGVAKTKLFEGLMEGPNTLTITETDQAGNQTTVSKIVTVNTAPQEAILPVTPGASYLNPEQYAASGVQNGIQNVTRTNGNLISRITTATEAFDYIYGDNGRLEKVTQSRLETADLVSTNLAKSGTVSVSSTYAGFDASKAIDETGPVQDFGWVSATAEGANDWLRVDLGKEINLEKIRYDTRFGPSYLTSIWQRAFKISVSADGINWTEVVTKSGQTAPQVYEFPFTSVKARYIKVHAIDSTFPDVPGWHHAYVGGLEAYEQSQVVNAVAEKEYAYTYSANGRLEKVTQSRLGAEELVLTNLAKSGTARASSFYAGYDPSKAVDEISPAQDYGWTSATASGANDWLSVDLGREIDLGKIKYDTHFGPSYLTAIWQRGFKISVSVDGVNWSEVVSQSGQTSAQLYEFTFTSVRARYIKVHDIDSIYSDSPGWHHAYVSELGVYEASQVIHTIAEKEYVYTYDANGRVETVSGTLLGSIAPVVIVDAGTPSLVNVKTLTVNYTVDGVAKTKFFEGLVDGENILAITEADQAGNQTTVNVYVTVAPRSEIRVSSPYSQAETDKTAAYTFFDRKTTGIPSFDQRVQASISIALVTERIMRTGLRQFIENMISLRPAAPDVRPSFLQNGWEAIMKSVFPERFVRNDAAWSERASAPYDRKTHAVIFMPLSPFLKIGEQRKLFETAIQDLRNFPGKTVIFISSASWPDPELKRIEAQSEGRVVLVGSAKDPEQFVADFFSTQRKISALSRKRIHGAVQKAYTNIFGSSGSSLKQLLRHTLAIAAPQVFEAPTSTLGRISQQFLFQMDRRELGLRYEAYLKSAIRVGGHVKAAEIDELLKKDLIIRDQIPGRPGVTEITFAQQGIERILSVLRSIATARQFGRSA